MFKSIFLVCFLVVFSCHTALGAILDLGRGRNHTDESYEVALKGLLQNCYATFKPDDYARIQLSNFNADDAVQQRVLATHTKKKDGSLFGFSSMVELTLSGSGGNVEKNLGALSKYVCFEKLERLCIERSFLGPLTTPEEDLQKIRAIVAWHPKVKDVQLDNCYLPEEAVAILAELRHLEQLSLCFNPKAVAGLGHLTNHPALQTLSMDFFLRWTDKTPFIQGRTITELHQQIPNLEVLHSPYFGGKCFSRLDKDWFYDLLGTRSQHVV